MQINKRKALKFSKVMLVEIKKMPNPVPSQMAYFFRPKSFMALCELCTRLKKHDRLKKNKTVLKLSSLHDKKKWAKLVRTFPKRYPNHSKIDGTLKLTRIEGEIIKGKKVTRSQRYPK
jgi:hypothetical protein|tara:strand:- start:220 stop:573 length:354 start_codon:yes stop_codon:yes gene_type:complete